MNFDGIKDVLFNKSKVNEIGSIEIYSIIDGEVKLVDKSYGVILNFIYAENEERYYYGFNTVMNPEVINEQIKVLKTFGKIEEYTDDYEIILANSQRMGRQTVTDGFDVEESFKKAYAHVDDEIKNLDLTRTYELAKLDNENMSINIAQNQEKTDDKESSVDISNDSENIVENEEKDDSSNNTNENKEKENIAPNTQLLRDVVQIGDFVTYLGSNNEWQVLDVVNVTENDEITPRVKLISSYGTVCKQMSTGAMEYKLTTNPDKSDYIEYYDSSYADYVTLIPFQSDIINSYKKLYNLKADPETLEGALYVLPIGYWTASSVNNDHALANPCTYVDAGGQFMRNNTGNKLYLRPTITLKTDVKTSGKDSNGAWILE